MALMGRVMGATFIGVLLLIATAAVAILNKPEPILLITMERCARCEQVRKVLESRGVRLTDVETTRTPTGVFYFPTVYYSDKSRDDGARILSAGKGGVTWPKDLTVVVVRGREGKN